MEKIIWMPHLYDEFFISLDENFTREMAQLKIPEEIQRKLNCATEEKFNKKFSTRLCTPYSFYKDSPFITGISLGIEGKLLWTDRGKIDNLFDKKESSELITYSAHNIRNYEDKYLLLSLFDAWITRAEVLKSYRID